MVAVAAAPALALNWLVADQLGTPRMVIDQTGALANVKRHDYLPFGEELFQSQGLRTTALGYTGDTIRQKFTGHERDPETGLDYMKARYESSLQGRFVSADTVAGSPSAPQTLNLYAYVSNNPLRYTDPTGHMLSDIGVYQTSNPEVARLTERAEDQGIKNWLGGHRAPTTPEPPAPQTPKYPPVTPAEVNVVFGGQAFESVQTEIVSSIVEIANRQACSDAFKAYDLTIPCDVVKSGKLRVAGVAALYQDNAQQLLGLSTQEVSDSKTQFRKQGGLLGSGFFKTLTAERAYPSVPLAIFNPSQVRNPDFGGLRAVVTHTFIHLGGQRGDRSARPHDLAKFRRYAHIINACRQPLVE